MSAFEQRVTFNLTNTRHHKRRTYQKSGLSDEFFKNLFHRPPLQQNQSVALAAGVGAISGRASLPCHWFPG